MSKTILITGGTGLVGSQLVTMLQSHGHQVRLLSRSKGKEGEPTTFLWDYKKGYIEPGAFDGVDTLYIWQGLALRTNDGRGREKKKY